MNQDRADKLTASGQRHSHYGRIDKPFHRPECQCDDCLSWIEAHPVEESTAGISVSGCGIAAKVNPVASFALLMLFLASPLLGQSVKLPAEVKGMPGEWIVVAPETIDGGKPRWRLGAGLEEVNLAALFGDEIAAKAKGKVVKSAKPGWYRLEAWNAKGDVASEIAVCEVFIGAPGPLPPTPPDPPTPPGPVVPPVVSGKRSLLLIHESADDTPEVSRMLVGLRQGPAAAYLASKSHKLHILDDDSVDATGKPAALLEPWRPHFAGMKLPALFVLDETGKTLIHKQELPAGTTAAQVVEIVKGKGG